MSHHTGTASNHETSACGCGGCHTHDHIGEDNPAVTIIRLSIGAVLFAAALLLQHAKIGITPFAISGKPAFLPWMNPVFLVFLIAFLFTGYDVIFSAVKNILRGRVFDENFLMGIASIGAFLIGEYPEGVAVMLFYEIGELLQNRAAGKSRKSIEAMMDMRPDYANMLPRELNVPGDSYQQASFQIVDPDLLIPDDIILVKPGERVPVDSVIIAGSSGIDVSALTGESLPANLTVGDSLLSGSVNISGVLYARVTHPFSESTASKILDLVQNASNKKSKSESFITKFARYYTPAVVAAAVLLAVIPPLVMPDTTFRIWLYRALLFLVVSCPCALVISVPLSFFGGIGGAARHGILVKGGNYLDALSHAEVVVFDKTGTLTKGIFQVVKVAPQGVSEAELLEIAAHAEAFSNHPISVSLRSAYGKEVSISKVSEVEEVAGQGVRSVISGHRVLAGNRKLMQTAGLEQEGAIADHEIGTVVHLAMDDHYIGYIVIADEIKSDAAKAVTTLKANHIQKIVMLTGDTRAVAESVSAELGVDEVYAELLPADKVAVSERLLAEKSSKSTLVFVGDGINDAPVLARADIGIAMGGIGSDAAIEAADVVIMTDEPSKVALAIRIARHTTAIANQNIVFALGVKALVLLLGAMGLATMWAAIFADVGVSLIAVLNALRAMHIKA